MGAIDVVILVGAIILFVVVFAVMIAQSELQNKRLAVMSEKLKSLEGFTPTQQFLSDNGISAIAIDEGRDKICFIRFVPGMFLRILSFQDVLSSEIVEDGVSVTKTSRSSQAAGALLGSLIGGGAGALAGSLTGSKTTRKETTIVDLRVIVNDTQQPIHVVNFMSELHGGASEKYPSARGKAEQWQALIDVIIRRADATTKAEASTPASISAADELFKLVQLRDQGVLTSAEFEHQKGLVLRRQ